MNSYCQDIVYVEDGFEALSLSILSDLLFTNAASPFYKHFIEKGLAGSFSPGCGFNFIGKHGIFSIGFSGVKNDEVFLNEIIVKIKSLL